MKTEYHITKDGRKIKLTDLDLNHLENIIKLIKYRAKKGFTLYFGGGFTGEDIWYDEKTYYGKEAKKILNYSMYKNELYRRNLIKILKS